MKNTSIPDVEFQARIKRTRKVMAEHGVDTLLAFSTESEPFAVRYYSDYWPSFETAAVLIPADGAAALLIGPESMTFAAARSK
ncbi:MAG: aminopeptidase P family N-terminal domain-containing protein, partial [Kiritimatiellota bacterium]|nr:aminopeptidase P family N-terminal domain-containing protein [Kiritimatiellota bacterium]